MPGRRKLVSRVKVQPGSAQDYIFDEGPADLARDGEVRSTRLSELFDAGKEKVYSYMFGPAMATPCTSCTSILDGLNGTAP